MKRILYIPSTMTGGVYYYRVYTPMKALCDQYQGEYDITINNTFNYTPQEIDNIGKTYEIVIFHNCLFIGKWQDKVWEMIVYCKKEYGTKFVLDLDDYWDYGPQHPYNEVCRFNAYPEKMTINFKMFDYVTTTTEYFKKVISKWFPEDKIYVFENAISSNDTQFTTKKNDSDKLRIGLTGGSSHKEDIKQLIEFPKYLTDKQCSQIELVLCGYDVKNTEKISIDENGEAVEKSKMSDKENWWVKIDNKFKTMLPYNYHHIETKSINNGEYGHIYEDIDVLLVPLNNTEFNRCKSELKFIEAGFTNTAIIVSDVIPYNNFGVNEEDCLLVKEPTPQAWAKAIKKILREKELLLKIRDINSLRIKYSRNLEDVTKRRHKFFSEI